MSDPIFAPQRLQSQTFEMLRKYSFAHSRGQASRVGPERSSEQQNKMWNLMSKHMSVDIKTIQRAVVNHVEYTLAKNRWNVDEESLYRATAYSVRDRLLELFNDSNAYFFEKDVKRCYYLSLEFLVGRALQNALVNMDLEESYSEALSELGYSLENLYEYEHDAALGNGGLGRLAACFLDSMATCNYACWGYGIRYSYGIFEQKLVNGWQVEYPDYWLLKENPWEICRPDVTYAVRFGGEVRKHYGTFQWVNGQIVQALAYDNPVPGFDTFNCINLRLWRAVPSKEFDFDSFNQGRYLDSVRDRQDAEAISAVLYPNDNMPEGKELRLKQQYFFVCATIQDVLRRFKKIANRSWDDLPSKMAIQLNDTHPTIAIPELIRILVDIEKVSWTKALEITSKVFNYTNHTVLPEALEKWPADLIAKLLPRHLMIINEINHQFLTQVRAAWGSEDPRIMKMSIYEEGWAKCIRMANLAVIGSNKVNGVAAIHSDLVKKDLFPEFDAYFKSKGQSKFLNVTNGVTPRRWMHNANRGLSNLISEWLGSDAWLKDLSLLNGLMEYINDDKFVADVADVKRINKLRLIDWIKNHGGPELTPDFLFDVQVKRIHEYKRQQLNAFYMIHRYLTIKHMSPAERANIVPRCIMVGGKAAPGYAKAKTIIKLINNISQRVNSDADVSPYFKVFFLPNYNVSSAAIIIPASDINQQISTAGMEASGTGNMKFVMNGSLIIGTMDGATVEIVEECGTDTAFIFGALEPEVAGIRRREHHHISNELNAVFSYIKQGNLSFDDSNAHNQFCGLVDDIKNHDYYLTINDFPSYLKSQQDVDRVYKDKVTWTKKTIKAISHMGKFSTDRTIHDYARDVWTLEACPVEGPSQDAIKRLTSGRNVDSPQTVLPSKPITRTVIDNVPSGSTSGASDSKVTKSVESNKSVASAQSKLPQVVAKKA